MSIPTKAGMCTKEITMVVGNKEAMVNGILQAPDQVREALAI
jgi:hypothetical protein